MLGGRPPDGIGCAKLGSIERPATETVHMQAITLISGETYRKPSHAA